MLAISEKLVFGILLVISVYLAGHAFRQVIRIIRRGTGQLPLDHILDRGYTALIATLTQRTVLNARPLTSLVHFGIVWGFILYALVNLEDVLRGFIPDYRLFATEPLNQLYRLAADVLSIVVIAAMIIFLVRRFVWRDPHLTFNDNILLDEQVRAGAIQRDSALVGAFILGHVGSRFLGQSFELALTGPDTFQPFASLVAGLWTTANPLYLDLLIHAAWWLGMGLLLAFIPWFPQSKHFHLIMAPLNLLTQPARRGSPGTMAPLDLEDEAIELFGAAHIEHLTQAQIIDAYACIMCNRCQEVCPAYNAGTALSPAALEVNKRYFIKSAAEGLAAGQESAATLFETALSPAGVWACTACAACLEICPVGNEPLHDILNMRQYLTLMEGDVPEPLTVALTQAERTGDPWGNPANTRLNWAKDLDVPLLADKQQVDVLYWVGCAGAYDPAGQRVSRAMVQIFQAAGIDFAVLGEEERCNCEWARRSGQEALFQEAAHELIETFNQYDFKQLVTQCPHCAHTFKNEYPDFGGNYAVTHHSVFIADLLNEGRLNLAKWDRRRRQTPVTLHDPCFLGRYNGGYAPPRATLEALQNVTLVEMSHNQNRSLCCGGGGAQVWMETEQETPINQTRFAEAQATGAATLATACPFCAVMFNSAGASLGDEDLALADIAELVAARLEQPQAMS